MKISFLTAVVIYEYFFNKNIFIFLATGSLLYNNSNFRILIDT